MNKTVWIVLGVSLVMVNVAAELVFYFTGFNIVMLFRISLVLGITTIAAIFVGANMLINKLEEEEPHRRGPQKILTLKLIIELDYVTLHENCHQYTRNRILSRQRVRVQRPTPESIAATTNRRLRATGESSHVPG